MQDFLAYWDALPPQKFVLNRHFSTLNYLFFFFLHCVTLKLHCF